MSQFRVFVVEDDVWYAEFLKHVLELNPDTIVERYENARDCLKNLDHAPDLITMDHQLPDMKAADLFREVRQKLPDVAFIIISAQENINIAVELLKEGAFDYILKGEDTKNRLWNSVRLYREHLHLKTENLRLSDLVEKKYNFNKAIIGNSPGMLKVFSMMEKAAASTIGVSITGETGTGKELVASSIHYNSPRKNKAFVTVNIGAIPRELVESELFGYEKGAFTGAVGRKIGLFEEANGGTIFLDEIAEMDLAMQTKFLRVLQEREIKRVGGNQIIKLDVRVITATHKNLSDEVNAGNFRPDLFYRLMGLPIHLIPLRERGNDIMELARAFAKNFCKENRRVVPKFSLSAVKKLVTYEYPGNVRELKAVIELAIILCDSNEILDEHILFNPVGEKSTIQDKELTLHEYNLELVKKYLEKYNHNASLAAKKLDISRASIYRYMKEIKW